MRKKAINPIDQAVGLRVRSIRKQRKRSQEWLSEKLGLTFQQVQKYENGSNRISASRLHQIATALDKPVAYFFDDNPSDAPVRDFDLVTRMITAPGGVRLAEAYIALTDTPSRQALQHVAAALLRHRGTK